MANKPMHRKLISYKKISKKSINTSKIVEKSKFSLAEVITVVIVTSFISLLMGIVIANSSNKSGNYEALSDDMQNFLTEYNSLKDKYYGEFDEEELLNQALSAIISEIGDPYTEVIDDSLSNKLSTTLEGSFEGLGLQISLDNNERIVILDVIEDSPAEKAGLKYLDVIIKLNGEDVTGMSTSDFSDKVKKCDEKDVTLTIIRDDNEMNVTVTRDKVVLKSVYSEIVEKNNKQIGYIYINIFAANSGEQFIEQLTALEESGIDSLIIDLRGNTGGHLTSVEEIMNHMMDSNNIIYQIEDKTGVKKVYSKGKRNYDKQIVLLVNKASASASEMLTASLKENLNAVVVGKTTYGKGTVQEVQNSASGVQYKITTSKWLTPKGNWIHENGIVPDYDVDLTDEYYNNPIDDNDSQLQKALELLSK